MKPAITFNGKPINYEAVTYSKGFACKFVMGELVEVEGDTSPLIPATTKQQLIDAEVLNSPENKAAIDEIGQQMFDSHIARTDLAKAMKDATTKSTPYGNTAGTVAYLSTLCETDATTEYLSAMNSLNTKES